LENVLNFKGFWCCEEQFIYRVVDGWSVDLRVIVTVFS